MQLLTETISPFLGPDTLLNTLTQYQKWHLCIKHEVLIAVLVKMICSAISTDKLA